MTMNVKQLYQMTVGMMDQQAKAEKATAIARKKMEIAMLECDDKAIETARADMISAYEAQIDLVIAQNKELKALEPKLKEG